MVHRAKLLIFDLDGTLVDPTKRWYRLHLDLSEKYNFKPFSKSAYITSKRNGVEEKKIMQGRLKPNLIVSYVSERRKLIETWRYLKLDKTKPGVGKLLRKLTKDHNLILTTSRKDTNNLKRQIEFLGLSNHFKTVINGSSPTERVKKLKTCILPYKNQTSLVGDTELDLKIAARLKIKCILVCDGSRTKSYLERLKPHEIFDRISLLKPDE